MVEVVFLALALSMDAFAVAIGLGAKRQTNNRKMAFMAGLYFGVFQALMPLLGYWIGKGVLAWVASYAPWIAFILLAFIGIKMVYESFSTSEDEAPKSITHRVMFVLAIATSIDAMAAGFVLNLMHVNVILSCFIIGVVTFLFSYAGVFIGVKSGSRFESKAELFGGTVLVLIGFKTLLF